MIVRESLNEIVYPKYVSRGEQRTPELYRKTKQKVQEKIQELNIKYFNEKDFNYYFNKLTNKGGVNPSLLWLSIYELMPNIKSY